jgi:hypothetical protein
MKTHPVIWSIVLSIFILFLSQPVFAEDPAKDAKAIFVKLVKAAKAKNTAEFKSLIAKEDLKEMEKEGFVDIMMDVMAEENPDLFKANVQENQVIFTKEIQKTSPEGTSSEKTTVHMLKEDGQWKFGKPRASE